MPDKARLAEQRDARHIMQGKGSRRFRECRSWVRALGLKSLLEWLQFSSSGARPAHIPADPDRVFRTEGWVSYDNWLHGAGATTDYAAALHWPKEKLGGYVLDLPDNTTAAAPLIDASLRAARDRGLTWLYPTVKCKHGTGPHQGSCTYADLPSYFDELVDAVERLGAED